MTTLLVASGGGHLAQLQALSQRMGLGHDVAWAVPTTGLSKDLLSTAEVHEIPYVKARDWRLALRLLPLARRIIRETGAERIVSTGAAPAPPFFLVGRQMGLDLHYVETATRSQGPSLSGKLVALLPGANLYTQYPHLAGGRWNYAGSVFDPFGVVEYERILLPDAALVPAGMSEASPVAGRAVSEPDAGPLRRIVVSLGTEDYDFRRAVEALLVLLPADAEVLWQTGATDVSGLPIRAHKSVPAAQLRQAITDCDLFISHAGTGSALTALELGKRPLLLPRDPAFGEHIDSHQQLTAAELSRRGLAVSATIPELTHAHLQRAAAARITSDTQFRPFPLVGMPEPSGRVVDGQDSPVQAVPAARAGGSSRGVPDVIDLTTAGARRPRRRGAAEAALAGAAESSDSAAHGTGVEDR